MKNEITDEAGRIWLPLKDVKNGSVIQFKANGKEYIKDGYCRYNKKYCATSCDDISKQRYNRGSVMVII